MPLEQGQLLNNCYEIEQLLYQDDYEVVYLAADMTSPRQVVIKENLRIQQSTQQFQQRATLLMALSHPSLAGIVDYIMTATKQYVVMDFVEGVDLWSMVEQQGAPLSEKQALDYIIPICDALTYLHTRPEPIIHRDVRPKNIKITSDGRAILVGFDSAKLVIVGQFQGDMNIMRPGFSPPEQHAGTGTRPTSDIYALGATLYAISTGHIPPDSVSLWSREKTFIPANRLNPAISQELTEAINNAMSLMAKKRPSSVEIWKQQLVAVARGDKKSKDTRYCLLTEQGHQYSLGDAQQLTVGRHISSSIKLDNDDLVSRHHAVIKWENQRCMLYDPGSSNGTFINGQRVDQTGMELKPDDVLAIGRTRLYLRPIPTSDSNFDLPSLSSMTAMSQPTSMYTIPSGEGSDGEKTYVPTRMNQTDHKSEKRNKVPLIIGAGLIVGLGLIVYAMWVLML